MRRLGIRPHTLLVIVLGYPLLHMVPYIDQDIGFVLDNLVLLPLTAFIALLTVAQGNTKIRRSDLRIYLMFLLMIGLVAANSLDLQYLKPLLSLLSLFITYHFMSGMKTHETDTTITYILLLYLFASVVALAMPSRFYNLGRFSGFTLSPTVFSVYLEAILILFLYTDRHALWKVLAFVAVAFFVLLSGTRLNVLFLAGLPFLILAVRWMPRWRGIFQIAILILLNLLYPAYAWFTQTTGQTVTTGRDQENVDSSFELRYALFTTLAVELATSSPRELLMGQGAGAARGVVQHFNVLPHNDFLRIAIDFGIPGLLLFLYLMYCIAVRSTRSFLLLNLYFVAFYHNIAYIYYMLFIMLYFSFLPETTRAAHRPDGRRQPRDSGPQHNEGGDPPAGDVRAVLQAVALPVTDRSRNGA